ncbi:hypothetical protein BsWGS_16015 [Bradybaena similaris]
MAPDEQLTGDTAAVSQNSVAFLNHPAKTTSFIMQGEKQVPNWRDHDARREAGSKLEASFLGCVHS